jgi:hypothetical protein
VNTNQNVEPGVHLEENYKLPQKLGPRHREKEPHQRPLHLRAQTRPSAQVETGGRLGANICSTSLATASSAEPAAPRGGIVPRRIHRLRRHRRRQPHHEPNRCQPQPRHPRHTLLAGVVGGTASALGGGKFANGFVTAAMQHLTNAEGWINKIMETVNSILGAGPIDAMQAGLERGRHRKFAVDFSALIADRWQVEGWIPGSSPLPNGGRDNDGGWCRFQNSVQHTLWQASITYDTDASQAYAIATAHELGSERTLDSVIDIHNNGVGVRIGQYSTSRQDILNRTVISIFAGELITTWTDPRLAPSAALPRESSPPLRLSTLSLRQLRYGGN